jgi:hypothetical protein
MAYRFAGARGFAEIPSDRSALGKLGPLNWLQAPSFIQDADTKLQLGGQLVKFYAAKGITFEPIPAMSEQEWNAFLERTRKSEVWRAFSERASSGIRYTVLVEYDEVRLTNTDLGNARIVRDADSAGRGAESTRLGLPPELERNVALYRCKCGKVLKVLLFSVGGNLTCPNCGRPFRKPQEGKHTETFAGLMTVSLIRAHVFACQAKDHPGSVCDYCLSPTKVHNGYVASSGIMLLSDIGELIPYYPKPVPREAVSGMIRLLQSQIEADQSPWLLCERCAGIVFRTALYRILTIKEQAEIWDVNQYAENIRDFLGDYERHFDVIGENKEK